MLLQTVATLYYMGYRSTHGNEVPWCTVTLEWTVVAQPTFTI